MQIVVLDTETTGLNPDEGAALLEVAHVCLNNEEGSWTYGEPGTYDWDFIEYGGDIPPEARAIHHIGPEDVRPGNGAVPKDIWLHGMVSAEEPDMVYASHNIAFDRQFLKELDLPWICTYRVALHIYPDAPSHSAQCLRYYTGAKPPATMLGGLAPHRAAFDAACTAALLHRMLQEHSVEKLLRLTAAPVELVNVKFGKHKGMKWSEVPLDYCRWVIRDGTFDPDVTYTAKRRLGLI